MYLMDEVAQAAHAVTSRGRVSDPVLEIFPRYAERLHGIPRFLLSDAAVNAAVELTLGRPSVLRQAMASCSVPYPRMWVEWAETGRARLRKLSMSDDQRVGVPIPQRLGFLIECTEGRHGRAGTITWMWSSGKDAAVPPGLPLIPNISPLTASFDLDQTYTQPQNRVAGLGLGNLSKMWEGNPVQHAALYSIWETAQHLPSEWGAHYLSMFSGAELGWMLANAYADVYGEYIIIWGILLMLTASKQAVEYHKVDRSKINAVRHKRRQAPLLDHTEVVLHITPRDERPVVRGELGYARKSPRIHYVGRYLARRGDKHWIVEPYLRGSGEPLSRNIHVKV